MELNLKRFKKSDLPVFNIAKILKLLILQVVPCVISKIATKNGNNISKSESDYEIEDWIDSFQNDENYTNIAELKNRQSEFRYSYLTYLKLLSELNAKTELSEENDDEAESEEIIFPPSHSLTQTDREYFNIVRTEDGRSSFTREKDKKGH